LIVPPSRIALNGVGYFPNRLKRATVLDAGDTFSVVSEDGTEVRSGLNLEGPVQDETGREVWIADFSDLREPGTYRLHVPGVGDSPEFTIQDRAYDPLLDTLMAGMYGWRCGTAVNISHQSGSYRHGACHMKDALMDALPFGLAEDTRRPVQGGWHDAGDYGKYIVNAAFSASIMLKAMEYFPAHIQDRVFAIPETGGSLPDYLDEIGWELDWMLKMQFDSGGVSLEVQTPQWPAMIVPEADTFQQHITTESSVATAYFAAVMAQAARVYDEYDSKLAGTYLEAAQRAQGFLQAHPAGVKYLYEDIVHIAYGGADEGEARMWASAELWETTGDPANLSDFESRLAALRRGQPPRIDLARNWDWAHSANLAAYTYLLSQRADESARNSELVSLLETSATQGADEILSSAIDDVYGNGLPSMYYWGINGVTARTTLNLAVAYRLTEDSRYLDGIVTQVDHLLGRNYYARSQVTGIGYQPPLHPHHRPSTGLPYPGLLVGGPNRDPAALPERPSDVTDWHDDAADFYSNEVAINWNASLIFGVIAAQEPAEPYTGSYRPALTLGVGAGGAGGAGNSGGDATGDGGEEGG
jgi:endoglucanase